MQLTSENYYSQEANREYMSVSGYKDFAGTYGKLPCEFHAMEKLNGNWEDEKTTALLVGSYVDSYFEGSLEQFKKDNKEIFTQKGDLKSDYKQAENIIARIERDKYFMKYMSGQKQVIMTGELFGTKWNGYKLTYEAELVEGRTEQQTLQEWLRRENEWQKNRAKASSKSKDAK